MKIVLIIYLICLIPTFLVYPTIKSLPQQYPNIVKFFLAWLIMPSFILWQIYTHIFNKNK